MRAKVRMGARRQSPACDRLCCEGSSWYERNNAAVTLKWGSFEVKKPSRNEGNTQAAFKNNVESSRSSSAGVFLNSPYAWSCSKISKIGHPIPSTSSSYFHIFSHTVTECNWVAGINPLFLGTKSQRILKSCQIPKIGFNNVKYPANSCKFNQIRRNSKFCHPFWRQNCRIYWGEDAFFTDTHALGVADGVGGLVGKAQR